MRDATCSLLKNRLNRFLYLEIKGHVAEPQVLRGHEPCQEDVDALPNAEWHRYHTVGRRGSVQTADEVGQVVQDGQIVFHHEDVAFGFLLFRENHENEKETTEMGSWGGRKRKNIIIIVFLVRRRENVRYTTAVANLRGDNLRFE